MISDAEIKAQLPHVLAETHLDFLGKRYQGKVRDNYSSDGKRYLITSDRLSCFDVVVTTVPFKGQVLNQLAAYWFEQTKDIVANHVIDIPDPNVVVAKEAQVLPLEVVVRGYLAGSAWRDYQVGKPISGISLPSGLRMSARLEKPILTPSTKAERGSHDLPISEQEILARRIVPEKVWHQIKEIALALFARGTERVAAQGLLLVDTKYEFGIAEDKLMLVDELHTLDSSRFWVASSYADRFRNGETPEMLDKEPTRQWLLERGFKGDGAVPEFTSEHRVAISRHYIDAFSRISGLAVDLAAGPVLPRIERNLRNYTARK